MSVFGMWLCVFASNAITAFFLSLYAKKTIDRAINSGEYWQKAYEEKREECKREHDKVMELRRYLRSVSASIEERVK